jgi:hypothetical protein
LASWAMIFMFHDYIWATNFISYTWERNKSKEFPYMVCTLCSC